MKTTLAALGLSLLAAPAMAALSGYHDSAAQIAVILGSDELADKLRQLPIKSLDFEGQTRDGLLEWEVESVKSNTGESCEVDVYLRAIPPGGGAGGTPMVGATSYEIARIGRCD